MKRREFIALAATAAATAHVARGDNAAKMAALPVNPAAKMAAPHMESRRLGGSATGNAPVPPRNRRPYADVDWSKVQEVHTTSHGHCENQKMLDAYLDRGFEFLTISNYYPSAPTMPLKTFRDTHYRVHHDFPVMVKGKRVDGPFDWTKIVSEWKDELPPELQKQLPFTEGKLRFSRVPDNILEAPNAEHHCFRDDKGSVISGLHMCAPGSAFCSGTFDKRNRFLSHGKGYCFGSGEHMHTAVSRMVDGMIFPDGGGVTINHPAWSHLKDEIIWDLLDYDPRVLGIEVYNMCKPSKNYPWSRSNCEDYWDRALSTGRQCFGFFVPDWGLQEGVNVLLVPEKSVHACLQAYRRGNWYGAIKGRKILRFTSILFDGANLQVTLDKPAHLQVITKRGVTAWANANKISFSVAASDREKYGYLRVRAYARDDSGEIIFSQPMMLT